MANFYVYRIKNGKLTLDEVPEKWRDKVAEKLGTE